MTLNKSIVTAMFLLLCSPICAKDEAVGVYALNWVLESDPSVVRHSNMVVNKDNTFIDHSSLALTQEAGVAPEGLFGSVETGIWKHTEGRSYSIAWTNVNVKKSPLIGDVKDYSLPGTDYSRFKAVGNFKLSKDGKRIKGTFTISIYDINDTCFSHPLPVGTFTYSFKGRKLDF